MTAADKKWKAPKNWDLADEGGTLGTGEAAQYGITATRTYPDGTTREILAHSEDELATLAAAADAQAAMHRANYRQALLDEAAEHKAKAKELEKRAAVYDWARP